MKSWKSILIAAALVALFPALSRAQWVPTNGPYCGGTVDFLCNAGENLVAGISAPMVSRPNLVPAGIFISRNRGESWKEVLSCSTDTRFVSTASIGKDLFVSSIHHVYLSSDDGRTWIEPDTSLSRFWITAFAAMSDQGRIRLFLATRQHGVFVSTDRGKSWWKSSSQVVPLMVASLAVSGRIVYAATDTGVLASTDYGISWHKEGLDYIGINEITVSGTGIIYVSSYPGLFYSTDRGNSWMVANSPARGGPVSVVSVSGRRLFARVGRSLFVSTNSGKDWKSLGLENEWVTSVVVDGKDIFVGTNSDGVYRSDNRGLTWRTVNDGTMKAGVFHLASDNTGIYAGAKGFGVYKSTNGGQSWHNLKISRNPGFFPNTVITSLDVSGNEVCARTWSALYYSPDAGASWKNAAINGRYGRWFASALALSGPIIFSSNEQTLVRSTDGGRSWSIADFGLGLSGDRPPAPASNHLQFVQQITRIGPDIISGPRVFGHPVIRQPQVIRNVQAIDCSGRNIYAGVTGGCFYFSGDQGDSWVRIDSGITAKDFNQITDVGGDIYALTEGDGVLKSTDSGRLWTKVNDGFTDFDAHVLVYSGQDLFVGTGNGIYFSDDRGRNWTRVNDGLKDSVVIGLTINGDYLYCGTWDHGVWKRKISDIVASAGRERHLSGKTEIDRKRE